MPNEMTFQQEGDYIVCYIDGVEVSRAKKAADGTSTAEVIDIINDQIKANPTLAGTEPDLTGLEVSGDKYAVPQGGGVETLSISISNWGTEEQPTTVQLTQEQMQKISDGAIIEIIDESDEWPNKICYKSDDDVTENMFVYFTSYTFGSGSAYVDLYTYMVGIDKTSNTLIAIMMTKSLTSAYTNSILDANENHRFIEGDGTPETISGFTFSYNKWSLSGTHLMMVCAGTVDSANLTSGLTICTYNSIPDYIKNKIVALWFNGTVVDVKTVYFRSLEDSSGTSVNIRLVKENNNLYVKCYTSQAVTNVGFRIQFDLLIDSK